MSFNAGTQFANREVMEAIIVDYATKKPFTKLDYANTVTHEVTGESVFAYGGKQHPKRVTFFGEKGGTIAFETQMMTMKLYQLALGASDKTSTKFLKREEVTVAVENSTATLTVTGTPVAGTVNVFAVTDDCGTPVSSTFTVSSSTITVDSADTSKYTNGTKYIVYYVENVSNTNRSIISVSTNTFPKEVEIYGTTFEKTENGTILDYKLKVYKAAPQPTFNFSWANTGDPATVTITFDLLGDDGGNLVDYILEEEPTA